MTQRRRRRVRAADLVPPRRSNWFSLLLLTIALVVVIGFNLAISDQTAGLFEAVVGDPSADLPEKLRDPGLASPDAGPIDAARHIPLDAVDAAR